jgi:hypothetical protein
LPNPLASDGPHWAAALEHYHWDRLDDALREAVQFGLGEAGTLLRWYRVIEAETVTRRRSEIQRINGWLQFEVVPEEIQGLRDSLVARALEACEQVAGRLGWNHEEATLITVLSEETEGPWATSPYGYCVAKEPYHKICLPPYLVDEPEEYSQAVAHEYAHVISITLADGYAPRWLEECVSVLVERRLDARAARELLQPGAWQNPPDLEMTFDGRQDDTDADDDAIWLAYQQAGWLGMYLTSLGDEARLGRLLREAAHEGIWRNLQLVVRGQERVDGALSQVYGFDSRELFRRAREWLRTHSDVDERDSEFTV